MRFFSIIFLLLIYRPDHVAARDQKQQQLAGYFQKVHKAAVAICKRDMEEAKSLYHAALKAGPYTYFIDLNNALYAEVYSREPDTVQIKAYLVQMQAKGVCVHEKYKRYPKIAAYTHLVDEATCKQVKNEHDRIIMAQVIKDDQEVRKALRIGESGLDAKEISHRLYTVDSINYQIVLEVLNRAAEQRVALENYIGLEAYYHTLVVILHYSEQRYEAEKIFKMAAEGILDPRDVFADFDNCVERGYIHTDLAARACGAFAPFGTTSIIHVYPETIIKIPPDSCLAKINELRKQYYLQDLVEECKIKAYAQYHLMNGFKYPNTTLAADVSYLHELEERIVKKYKIIKYKNAADFDYNRKF